MFKNNVFSTTVNTKTWLKAAGVRAVKTTAQAAIAGIGTTATLGSVNWTLVLSTSLLSGIVSVLTSAAGLPELDRKEETGHGNT